MEATEAQKQLHIDNQGDVYIRNRAMRRKKLPTDDKFTQSTHSINKKRNKNVKRKNQLKRKLARIRKMIVS